MKTAFTALVAIIVMATGLQARENTTVYNATNETLNVTLVQESGCDKDDFPDPTFTISPGASKGTFPACCMDSISFKATGLSLPGHSAPQSVCGSFKTDDNCNGKKYTLLNIGGSLDWYVNLKKIGNTKYC